MYDSKPHYVSKSQAVQLEMKVIDRGYAGICPNTFQERRHFSIQDKYGILKEDIQITCTRKELDRKLMQIRVQFNSANSTSSYSARSTAPWRKDTLADRTREAAPIGPGWRCSQTATQALQEVGVPSMLAKLGGLALDVLLTKKMHQDFLTNGKDMRDKMEETFKW